MPRHTARQGAQTRARVHTPTQRGRDRAERRQARAQVGERVAFHHMLTGSTTFKQPGRKYGPAPKQTSVGEVQRAEWQHPSKLENGARELNYRRQNGTRGLTPRQVRRLRQKGAAGA